MERDVLLGHPTHRRGVPHGHHLHGLLPAGRAILEELLPGLTAHLVAEGAHAGDLLENVRWYVGGR